MQVVVCIDALCMMKSHSLALNESSLSASSARQVGSAKLSPGRDGVR